VATGCSELETILDLEFVLLTRFEIVNHNLIFVEQTDHKLAPSVVFLCLHTPPKVKSMVSHIIIYAH
jgi:hypothetical protein